MAELNLIPTHDPCCELVKFAQLPGVVVDLNWFNCPLEDVSKHNGGKAGTRCWCRGKIAACELEALGFPELANAMRRDYTAEECKVFGSRLLSVVQEMRSRYAGSRDKPKGAGKNGVWNNSTLTWLFNRYSSFDEALEAIEDAAKYYVAVAGCGSGVRACT